MSTLAISHEQRDQIPQDFETLRHHANLDEGSVSSAPTIDFSKNPQIHESMGFYGSYAGPASIPPGAMWRHVVAVASLIS